MNKSIRTAIMWLVSGAVSCLIFILLFNHAFPVASVDILVNRTQALDRSRSFIQGQGFDLEGFDQAIIFYSDYDASVYLQKTQKIKRSNQLIRQGVPVWFWRVRWFKELEKEGFLVNVDPRSGEIVYFQHFILDDKPGADLTQDQAALAAREKVTLQQVNLQDYDLKDSTTQKQKNRTDYKFSWEKKDYQIEQATLRAEVNICGAELGRYKRYLKIPEGFRRYVTGELALGRMLAMVAMMLKYSLVIIAVFVLFFKARKAQANWRLWFGCAGLVAFSEILDFLNSLPLYWSFYPDTMSKTAFITESFSGGFANMLSAGLIVLAAGALAELSLAPGEKLKLPVYTAIKTTRVDQAKIMPVFAAGYALGFIFLAYVSIFYIIGGKFFSIWVSPQAEYSNIFGMVIPALFPLTIALSSAIQEELIYRLFAITFLKKIVKRTWLALLIPALIWGFAHSFYHVFPSYIRGIELTVFGLILGWAFLRYGVEATIMAHFVINAMLAGLPLLRSQNQYFIISGIIVMAVPFIPLIIMVLKRKGKKMKASR